jgi:hypothetical protein
MSRKFLCAVVVIAMLASSGQAAFAQGPRQPAAGQKTSVSSPAPGGIPGAAPYDADDPWDWGDVAVLRGLDKVTFEYRDFKAPVGKDVDFYGLTISVKRCAKRPPEAPTPETIVGMEIRERETNGEGQKAQAKRIYSGWMFASSPALNPLDHPVYDVWVLDCINSHAPPTPTTTAQTKPILRQQEDPGKSLD